MIILWCAIWEKKTRTKNLLLALVPKRLWIPEVCCLWEVSINCRANKWPRIKPWTLMMGFLLLIFLYLLTSLSYSFLHPSWSLSLPSYPFSATSTSLTRFKNNLSLPWLTSLRSFANWTFIRVGRGDADLDPASTLSRASLRAARGGGAGDYRIQKSFHRGLRAAYSNIMMTPKPEAQ